MHASIFATSFVALVAMASGVVAGWNLPAQCTRNATVEAGNTCDDISAANDVSTYQLAAVNSAVINVGCTNLYVGEVLCLGIAGQDCTTTHVVQKGDTCYTVSDAAGISVNTLLQNNPNVNKICTNLYIGEVVCTSKETYVNITYP